MNNKFPRDSGAIVQRYPRVLVLMATYQGEAWVCEQLESVLSQRDVEVYVVVSDDCSSDATAAHVRNLARLDSRISLVTRIVSSGSAGANFRFLFQTTDFSEYDYVALADQDDVWDVDHLIRSCNALANSGAAGTSCSVTTFGHGQEVVVSQGRRKREFDYLFEGGGQGCTFVLTSDLAAKVKSVCCDGRSQAELLHYHDWLIYLVARVSGFEWYFDSHPSVRYRQHSRNEIGARSSKGALKRRLALIRGGWYVRQVNAAVGLAVYMCSDNGKLSKLSKIIASPHNLWRRLRLALGVLQWSRRRRIDSVALALAAAAGWI